MKKILFILLSAFVLGSCDFLDEESKTQIPLDNYFNNEEEAMLFLYGAYYQVRNTVFGTDFMYLTDTMTDNSVPVENSLLYAMALRKYKISFELHVYPFGWHGLSTVDGMTNDEAVLDMRVKRTHEWLENAKRWLKTMW